MPEQTISPGVFTEERDQSSIQQGVQEIGGAFVGPTKKGPAFEPVEVSSPQEYERRFGNQGLYTDYSVTNYLSDASSATVVRLLGEEGYKSEAVEIQLPAGELSKRAFQVSEAEFSFDENIDPDETVETRICVRGRQRRSSSDDVLNYDLKVHEYVDGEWNGTVIEKTDLDQECFIGEFTPITNDWVSVSYEVEVERVDGQTDTAESPTSQVQGFYLKETNYNWTAGIDKGENEIVSLSGVVENINGSYDLEVFEVINGTLQDSPVGEETDLTDERFRTAFVHNGSVGDRVSYVVKVKNTAPDGEVVESVPDEISPPIDVINREQVTDFIIYDVNWSFVEDEKVDYGQKLQIEAETSQPVSSVELNEGGTNITNIQDVSGDPSDTSVYVEFNVGESGIDPISTGDEIEYELLLDDGNGNSEVRTSPTVEIDGGLFRITDVSTDFEAGEKVDTEELHGISFTVDNDMSDFDYKIVAYDGNLDDSEQLVPSGSGFATASSNNVVNSVPVPSNNFGVGDDLKYEIVVSQDKTGTPLHEDNQYTDSVNIGALNNTADFAFRDSDFSFGEGTVREGDKLFGSFLVGLNTVSEYGYTVDVMKNGSKQLELASGSNITENSFFFNEPLPNNDDFFTGDEIHLRVTITETGSGTAEATVTSSTLTFLGNTDDSYGIRDYNFQFESGEEVDFGERLAVHFEVNRSSWDGGSNLPLRYRVNEKVNGNYTGRVVTNTLEERGSEVIFQGDGTSSNPEEAFEATWRAAAGDTGIAVGDNLEYELVVEQYQTPPADTVLKTDSVTSVSFTVVEQTPDEDMTMAVLSPTKRLRRENDEILDAQINPNNADMTGFELILGLESNSPNGGGQPSSTNTDTEEDNPVESLLNSTNEENLVQSQDLTIDGKSYKVSLVEGDSNYLTEFFGTGIDSPREVFAQNSFEEVWQELLEEHYDEGGIDLKADYDPAKLDFEGQGYSNAETPWIVSQDQQPNEPGADRQKLFKFETLGDGNYANTDIKVSIANVRYPSEVPGSSYGDFDVLVREFEDEDQNPTVLESYSGVNLDPDSPNFIARMVGNRKTTLNENGKLKETGGEAGVFENRSDYVRVSVHPEVVRANQQNVDGLSHLVPWGFEPFAVPLDYDGQVPHGLKPRITQSVNDVENDIVPSPGINQDLTTAAPPFDSRIYFGFDFGFEGNMSWLSEVAENADSSGTQDEFDQDFGFVLSDAYVEDPNGEGVRQIEYGDKEAEGFEASRRKFSVAFQGGFDGQDPAKPEALEEDISPVNAQGLDLSSPTSSGTKAYKRAIGILGNEDQFDINLLVTPGVLNSLHSPVVQAGIDMVESRADCFYVFDAAGVDASISAATASIESVDTSYAATYYPWMRIQDQTRNKQVRVPPSVLIPRVYAFNDQTSAEWFAPAGFERGGIPEAISTVVRLRKEDRDQLYKNRVNPIAQFPGQGVSVWGQKTLQTKASALDRVNVRRLLIRVKKFIASTSRFLVFEQNVPQTRNRFLNIVNPFLNQVQQQNGLFAFRVQMNADNNPPEVVDRNKLVGEIFLQPTRTAEFIQLTFNVLPTGAEFESG